MKTSSPLHFILLLMICASKHIDQAQHDNDRSHFIISENDFSTNQYLSLKELLDKYGEDAFLPELIYLKGIGAEIVPKLRIKFYAYNWDKLEIHYRMIIMKHFYNSL